MCHDDETSDEQARDCDRYQAYIEKMVAADEAMQTLCVALLAYATSL